MSTKLLGDTLSIPSDLFNSFIAQTGFAKSNFRIASDDCSVLLDTDTNLSKEELELERYYYLSKSKSCKDFVLSKRLLIAHVQDTKKGSKKDLIEVLSSVMDEASLSDFFEIALEETLFIDKLYKLGGERVRISQDGDNTTISLVVENFANYEPLLGGTFGVNEIARLFTFKVNHAKWRDRKVRRFVSLKVEAIEKLPKVTLSE